MPIYSGFGERRSLLETIGPFRGAIGLFTVAIVEISGHHVHVSCLMITCDHTRDHRMDYIFIFLSILAPQLSTIISLTLRL